MGTQRFLANVLPSSSRFTSQNRIINDPFLNSPVSSNCLFLCFSLTAKLLAGLFKHLLILFPTLQSLIYNLVFFPHYSQEPFLVHVTVTIISPNLIFYPYSLFARFPDIRHIPVFLLPTLLAVLSEIPFFLNSCLSQSLCVISLVGLVQSHWG